MTTEHMKQTQSTLLASLFSAMPNSKLLLFLLPNQHK
jgi:hypothetical protein